MNDELAIKIDDINSFIRGKNFFEFAIYGYSNRNLLLVGSADLIYYHNIEIWFKNVGFLCCAQSWQIDTNKSAMEIIDNPKAFNINLKFKIERGQTLISMFSEDNIEQWIACESISVDRKEVRYSPLRVG